MTSKSKESDKKPSQEYPPCVVRNGKHGSCSCSVFKEKNTTPGANIAGEQKLCFSCLQLGNRVKLFENAQNLESAISPIATALPFLAEPKDDTPQKTRESPQQEKKTSSHSVGLEVETFENNCATSVLRDKHLLKIVKLKLSSNTTIFNILVFFCDSACTHSWISAQRQKVETRRQWKQFTTCFKDRISRYGNLRFK